MGGLIRWERTVLERAVRAVTEQAVAADALVRESLDAGLGGSHPVTLHAKMLRLELLNVKADLERELGQVVLDCSSCGRRMWIPELGVARDHWGTGNLRRTASPPSRCNFWPRVLSSERRVRHP